MRWLIEAIIPAERGLSTFQHERDEPSTAKPPLGTRRHVVSRQARETFFENRQIW
jgi:hypothetical protein